MRLAILSHILDGALVPFLARHYPTAHRFQQDNDPKHISCWAQNYFEENGINWWKTPASSPDLNPIENVCGSMKNHLRTNVKPRNLQELKDGIKEFWLTLTPAVCKKYIGHLKKVIPKVIEENGGPSGYYIHCVLRFVHIFPIILYPIIIIITR